MENNINNIFESYDSKDSINEMKFEYDIPSEEFLKFCDAVSSIFIKYNYENPNNYINPISVITVLRNAIEIFYGTDLIGEKLPHHTIEEAVEQAYEKHVIGYENNTYPDEAPGL